MAPAVGGSPNCKDISHIDFFNTPAPQTGAITGLKFHDRDGNTNQTAGEEGLSGWTIQLDNDNNAGNGRRGWGAKHQ